MHLEIPRRLPKHYSEIMKEVLNSRILKNENYSLRAFARDLNLSPGHLSEILTSKTTLSIKKSSEIASLLFLHEEDQNFFCKMVEVANAKDDQKSTLENQLYNFDSNGIIISNDVYSSISSWHSLALLELISLKCFRLDYSWIAQSLQISSQEAELAIENLLSVGLIELKDGKLHQQYDYFALPNGNKSNRAKDFHKLVLEKASVALDEQISEDRNFTAAFLHIEKKNVSAISEKIKSFRRQIAKEFESEEADSVYMFGIQLYKVDSQVDV